MCISFVHWMSKYVQPMCQKILLLIQVSAG